MQNFLDCIVECNNQEIYDNFASSGFFTLVREDATIDTKQETMDILAKHFGLAT